MSDIDKKSVTFDISQAFARFVSYVLTWNSNLYRDLVEWNPFTSETDLSYMCKNDFMILNIQTKI